MAGWNYGFGSKGYYPMLLTSHHTRSFSTEGYRGGVAEVYRGGGGGRSSRERRRHRADFASTVLGACGGGGGRWWRAGGGCVASGDALRGS